MNQILPAERASAGDISADYFRRWHRDKANAGGLLVHKSSHHFDLVNWWIASEPRRVFASGALRYYGSDYASGATLSYSLNAHAPWEGYRVVVNGTEGRVELDVVERGSLAETEGLHPVLDPSYSAIEAGSLRPVADRLILQRHWEEPVEIDIALLA